MRKLIRWFVVSCTKVKAISETISGADLPGAIKAAVVLLLKTAADLECDGEKCLSLGMTFAAVTVRPEP